MDITVSLNKIIISKRNKMIFIPLNEISYIERINQCSHIISKHDLVPVRIPLKYFEDILPNNFIRSHRSFIINKSILKELIKQDENNFEASFNETKTKALVSKGYLREILTT